VGHSTHLLSIGGARLLTDPWFGDPAFGALSHEVGPAVAAAEIGRLDAILVSHDHADHADPWALDRLDKRAEVVVESPDLAARVKGLGYSIVHHVAPWQSLSLAGGAVSLTAVPGLHDIPEVGFVVAGAGRTVYFAGDTHLHPDLPAIAERLHPTTAILPVDGTRIRGSRLWVMTPDDAVEAARILGVKAAFPSHAVAWRSDLVARMLVVLIEDASAEFAAKMNAALPDVRCGVVPPGGLVPIAPDAA
jgi:L-ascorbate metabolism protein UlaG (beta-lactamase superfamily)